MPSEKKKGCKGSPETEQYIWVSEIIRRTMSDKAAYSNKENVVFVLNFASRLDACNLREAESNTMFLNLMAATTSVQTSQTSCNSLIMVVDKYNDIPAWVYLNNPNIRTISVCVPDRNTRRLYLENLYGELAPFQLLSQEDYDPGKQFVAETEGLQLQELRQILQLAYRKDIKPQDINLAFRLYKYGVLDDPWENLENDILVHIESKLEERVKGQDEAIGKVMYLNAYRQHYPTASDADLMPFVRQQVSEDMRGFEPGNGTIAQSLFVATPQTYGEEVIAKYNGISINERYGSNYSYFTNVRQSDVKAKWKPAGCDTPRATVDHELGHQIAKLTNAHNDYEMQEMYSRFMSLSSTQRGEVLSGYAGESIHEFIAEGWSEYRNNPNCRPLAKSISNRLFDLYNQHTPRLVKVRR